MNFIKLKQEESDVAINVGPGPVALVSPSKLIGKTGIILINGLSLEVSGTFHEVVDQLNGQEKSSLI
jgi:hypothetical protein